MNLVDALIEMGWCKSRGEAKRSIMQGGVKVAGHRCRSNGQFLNANGRIIYGELDDDGTIELVSSP